MSAPRSSCARGPAISADDHDAAARPGDREVGHEVVATDGVQGDVDRPRRRGDVGGEGGGVELARCEHRVVEPELATALQFLGGPGGADHRAAERPAELQRGRADAGPDRVHQHGLARLERRPE